MQTCEMKNSINVLKNGAHLHCLKFTAVVSLSIRKFKFIVILDRYNSILTSCILIHENNGSQTVYNYHHHLYLYTLHHESAPPYTIIYGVYVIILLHLHMM